MFSKFFMYRYALMFTLYKKAAKDKDKKQELLNRLTELEFIMDYILGFDIGADIRNKALDLSNRLTEEEIRDKIKKMNNMK